MTEDNDDMMDLQAYTVVKNLMNYNGSKPCPQCGMLMNPVEAINSYEGLCLECTDAKAMRMAKKKMA